MTKFQAESDVLPVDEGVERAREIARDRRWLLLGVILFIGILAGVILIWRGYVFVERERQEANASAVASPVPSAPSTPLPTPVQEKLELYRIEILNGSGVSGAASGYRDELEAKLQEEGFSSYEVEVGNTDTREGTVIIFKNESIRRSVSSVVGGIWPEAVSEIDRGLAVEVRVVLGR